MARRTALNPYVIMWSYVMFDLPVVTVPERKQATAFRNFLLDLGFEMAQYSVYVKHHPTRERAHSVLQRLPATLPLGGKVDILLVTDKQFRDIISFSGAVRQKKGRKDLQLHLF
ncbi:MAG: CRISPR-associated endonuclease Cas2 [Gammaproteobacteria bacterium]